jgi:membrane-associated phospholipid phosphatase
MIGAARHAWYQYSENPEFGWARLVSDLFSPPVLWGALAFPIAFSAAPNRSVAILWAMTYVLLVCVLPVVYIMIMVRRGKIGDIHMAVRRERFKPLLVSIFATAIAWWTLRAMGAPPVSVLALSSMVQIGVLAIITLVWQVSMHTMSAAAAVIGAIWVYGTGAALIMMPLLALVSVARLRLHKHTPAQVIVGALIGLIVPAFMLGMAGI